MDKETQETMAALGHDAVETPEGTIEPVEAPQEEPEPEQDPEPVQEPTAEEPQEVESIAIDEEQQRRTWQSEADKAKAKAGELEAQLEAQRLQNQQLAQMLQTLGGNEQPQRQETPKARPKLWDFIASDQYDKFDALDPNTPSGMAYQQYRDAEDDWKAEQKFQAYEQKQREAKRQSIAVRQAQKLAEQFPEFKNPLTGTPDMVKIERWLSGLSDSEDENLWAEWYEYQNNKSKPKSAPTIPEIGKRANQVRSVSGQGSAEKESRPLPKTIKKYTEAFGEDFEYPAGADFE